MAMATSSPSTSSRVPPHLPSLPRPPAPSFLPLPPSSPLPSTTLSLSPSPLSRHFLPLRASVASDQQTLSSTSSDATKATKYYFVVANAKFMLDEEEHFQEQLKERLRNFAERNREQDFWLVIEPKFLDGFPDICKRLKRPAVALVSTDELWITFMKLRLDRVLKGEFETEKVVSEALRSNPADLNFEKPEIWTAPYPKYGGSWWTPFLPPQEQ